MRRVYIAGGLRSHIGLKNGVFREVPPEDLAAGILKETLRRFSPANPDLVIGGNAAGTGGNLTRLALLKAGLPQTVPGLTLDAQCASGLEAVSAAYAKIASGEADLVLAGGMESASLQPYRQYHPRDPRFQGDGSFRTAQFSPEEWDDNAMLRGAERAAKALGVTREELDKAALESHQKALAAREKVAGRIYPLFGSSRDEGVREKVTAKLLARLAPVEGERTTAGNSCSFSDGAAFLLLCSADALRRYPALKPEAEILSCALVGGDPQTSPLCAQRACELLLEKSGRRAKDIEVFEFNEAFAVISVHFARRYPELASRFCPLGGALAYGHPYGASGGILLLHLLESLSPGGYGVCSIAAAGGLGSALLIRKEER